MDFKIELFDTEITYLEGELCDDLRQLIEGNNTYQNKGVIIKLNQKNIIWVEDPDDVSTIAHESFHVICRILGERGIPLNESTEEVYAYTLGYVMNQILRLKDEQKKQHQNKND